VQHAPIRFGDDAWVLEHRLADELDRNVGIWADAVIDRVAVEVPALVADEERATLARESSRALLNEFASTLRVGFPQGGSRAPAAALAFARHLARRSVPLAGLLRAYRLGQELLFSRAAELGANGGDIESVARVGLLTFRYVDGVVAEVAEAFENEREAFLRGALARRERLVSDLLAGADVDLAAAEVTLGRRLSGQHLAVIAWRTEGSSDPEAVASAIRPLLGIVGQGRPLTVLGATGDVYAWTTPRSEAPDGELDIEQLRAAGVRVALGLPGRGVDGFLASRRQADAARRVWNLRPDDVVLRYADVALLHLLLRDPVAATAFAREQLGGLAAAEPRVATLRRTLATYLARGRDASATATALGVHRNTVARRLARAGQLVGRDLNERADELSVALTIALATVPDRS
jgi:DNA-binding PucR family transcriptional regulator